MELFFYTYAHGLVYFVPFIVSFAGSAHGSRAVNIGANSVNKMTQTFVLSLRHEGSEKKSTLLLTFCIYFSRDTPRIWCPSGPVAWDISLVMDNFLPTGFYDRWKREKSGAFPSPSYDTLPWSTFMVAPLLLFVTRVPLLLCFMNDSCGAHSLQASIRPGLIIFRVYLWQYCANAGGKKTPHSDIFLRSGTAGDGYCKQSALDSCSL